MVEIKHRKRWAGMLTTLFVLLIFPERIYADATVNAELVFQKAQDNVAKSTDAATGDVGVVLHDGNRTLISEAIASTALAQFPAKLAAMAVVKTALGADCSAANPCPTGCCDHNNKCADGKADDDCGNPGPGPGTGWKCQKCIVGTAGLGHHDTYLAALLFVTGAGTPQNCRPTTDGGYCSSCPVTAGCCEANDTPHPGNEDNFCGSGDGVELCEKCILPKSCQKDKLGTEFRCRNTKCTDDLDCKNISSDQCIVGKCQGKTGEKRCVFTPKQCDEDGCTTKTCNPTNGKCTTSVIFPDDTDCSGPCRTGKCSVGLCVVDYQEVDGTSCKGANECTINACEGGKCTKIHDIQPDGTKCKGGNDCRENTCQDGICTEGYNEPPGKHCSNRDLCNEYACKLGECWFDGPSLHTGPCTENQNPCETSRCSRLGFGNERKWCMPNFEDDGTVCEDGNQCTKGDHCADGKCIGNPVDSPLCGTTTGTTGTTTGTTTTTGGTTGTTTGTTSTTTGTTSTTTGTTSTTTGTTGTTTGTTTTTVGTTTGTTGPIPVVVTLTFIGTGTGTVTGIGSPSGTTVQCTSSCAMPFGSGDTVTLTGVGGFNSTFVGWWGGCVGTGSCILIAPVAGIATAKFDMNISSTCVPACTGTQTCVAGMCSP